MIRLVLLAGALLVLGCGDDAKKADGGVGGDARRSGEGTVAADGKAPPACASVTLEYAGTVATVSKSPLGLDSTVRTTSVSGYLSYKPCTGDSLPSDPKRGTFDHRGGGDFSLQVAGKTITGSGNPLVQVEDLDPDTFRWMDGPQATDRDPLLRQMKLDGAPAPSLKVWLAITDSSGKAFSSDALPASFPMLAIATYPHTFSVEDSGGTLLLQLSALTQK